MRQARFWLVCLFFSLWAVAIVARLFWLQIIRHSEYVERAQKQQQRTFEVAPRRGMLYDRNMHELAMTVQVDSIYAVPDEIDDKDKPAYARELSAVVHVDPEDKRTTEPEIAHRLDEGHGFAWVARRVTPEVSARVNALNLKGIYFQKEFQRFYPNSQIAAQVLGYVGLDDNGLGGLEAEVRLPPARHSRPRVHRHGRAPPRARLSRARARARPESAAHHRREHSVHGRDRARSRDGEDPRRQRHHRGAGRAHRPDSRPRHPPHLQPQRLSPHHARAAQRPRGQRCLRARLRLQARHLLRRPRLTTSPSPTT